MRSGLERKKSRKIGYKLARNEKREMSRKGKLRQAEDQKKEKKNTTSALHTRPYVCEHICTLEADSINFAHIFHEASSRSSPVITARSHRRVRR